MCGRFTLACVSCLQLVKPILMRCRAFLKPEIPFKVILPDPETVVCLDKGRLGQILTNGLRYAVCL